MNTKLFNISERILLTLWVGGMWITGYMIAPLLFQYLDKQTAGSIAGHIFTGMSYIGLVCGGLLLAGMFFKNRQGLLRNWRSWSLVAMLFLICIGEFVLQPMMAELKTQGLVEGSETIKQFGLLHGIASVLFLINSIAGLALIINDSKD
ncbi:MAG: DUF4149 domain-containing protein [Gammaproteobacteria bacterium]|nr:DUF4149 domain-containing protein [Gammaproteobacteria bacterium]